MRKARYQAASVLQFVERYNEHTIYHDVKSRFCRTNVIMQKRVKGYGLKCHRIVTEICKLVGISDLRCKVIGSKNRLNVVQAAFKALCSQETPQMLADRTGLRVVEMRSEMGMRPVVLAVPEKERVLYEKTRQAVGYGRH
ncbi:small ribosomal subunit protein uS5m-like isoform X2 [Corticium candelabrum]|uniref:small ribosomal subunit protein uS5m-like isoform X2 n=1 Tax=Corticium candelabrum TaxID=121492 RepID=UPI002E276CA3|nr:small ribosomal subunit protein uS5m-like isoform X2 [Corticium candelabrum]